MLAKPDSTSLDETLTLETAVNLICGLLGVPVTGKIIFDHDAANFFIESPGTEQVAVLHHVTLVLLQDNFEGQ